MANFTVALIILLIVGVAGVYIVKEKKKRCAMHRLSSSSDMPKCESRNV